MVAGDYWALSEEFVRLLASEGRASEASQLSEIIEGAFTSTELLMGVRHTLNQVDLNLVSEVSRKKIENYLDTLNNLLSATPR